MHIYKILKYITFIHSLSSYLDLFLGAVIVILTRDCSRSPATDLAIFKSFSFGVSAVCQGSCPDATKATCCWAKYSLFASLSGTTSVPSVEDNTASRSCDGSPKKNY